jgi:predicted branched-subunit amino acid permease
MALWFLWQISTAVGILLGPLLPDSWPLAFFVPLSFIALLVPTLKDWPSLIASIMGGLVAILAFGLPLRLGIIVAALLGIGAGLLAENWIPERTSTKIEKDVS